MKTTLLVTETGGEVIQKAPRTHYLLKMTVVVRIAVSCKLNENWENLFYE